MNVREGRGQLALTIYKNAVLTAIAVLLALVLVELRKPQQQFPTRGDLAALRSITDAAQRQEMRSKLVADMPLVWVEGGNVEISGGNVTVDGEVSIWR